LQYDEAGRTAVYTGQVVTMTTSDSDVDAGKLTFRLAAESRTLETMRAERAVWTKMSGGYEAVGDVLVYQAATDLYTLEGKAGLEAAQVKSPRSDAPGSKTPMCNLNDGMKLELDKKTGAVRVPGGGQAPQNVTAIACSAPLRRRK
jgi:lipopolysaccharide export system protein LptA